MTTRCSRCGRVLPPEAISWPSGDCYCSAKCAAEHLAPQEVVRRLLEAGKLEPTG